MKTELIVVGAGASGMLAAIFAARNGKKVIILENNDKAGRKLLATGNGKCNFSNLNQKLSCYNTENSEFVQNVFNKFGLEETLSFFKELGLLYKDRNGYLYPCSEQAASVCNLLLLELKRLKVKTIYKCRVEKIVKEEQFKVYAGSELYEAEKVILASGGCAAPKLGATSDGYNILKAFGHKVSPLLPGLLQLTFKAAYLKTISGVRTEAEVSLYVDNKYTAKEEGEILFADYGISGIPIMQLSRFASLAVYNKNSVKIKLDFLKNYTQKELHTYIYDRIEQNPYKSIEELLVTALNNKLAYIVIKECMLNPEAEAMKLKENDIIKLVKKIKEFEIIIENVKGFENAQVTVGGAELSEFNAFTMESKLVKGLFVTGELLNVDGTCGGYNLQWAFSTGALAGNGVAL